jgi:hypothetical protein
MKPSMALTMLEAFTSTIIATEHRLEGWKLKRLELLDRLDRGEDIAILGQEAADAIGAEIVEAHEEDAPKVTLVAGPTAPVAPAKRRGRPPKQATLPGTVIGDDKAREPVDEAKNAAEIRVIVAALASGPLTVGELVMNSGVSRPDVMRHLASGAVIEEYEGSRAPGMAPILLVRLVSQRPAS